jgi:S1-C subfamily serine protease
VIRPVAFVLMGAGAALALVTWSIIPVAASDSVTRLEAGKPIEVTLDLDKSARAEFRVDLPADAVRLRWKLATRRVELDLRARAGKRVGEEDAEQDFKVSGEGGEASIVYDRFSDPAVGAGPFFASVEWPYTERPRTVGERLQHVAFTIRADVVRARVDGKLAVGQLARGAIDAETGGFRTFTIDVPAGVPALRLDIAEATSDVDLFARRGGPFLVLDDTVRFAQHAYGRESLVITGPDGGPLEAGTWYVDVVDAFDEERPIDFALLAGFDPAPPAAVLAIPAIPATIGGDPLGRALAAVVEISTDESSGSGTLLTKDGWILSNAHVVEDLGGVTVTSVVVAVTLDPALPPVELFRADVREVDRERDMALLKVTSGFYGQALPQGMVFPSLAIASGARPAIGDVLFLVGYPSTGGQGSRVTISATRGIVSGYDTAAFGSVLKTDAEITNGNSGGAALDAQGNLVGIPTSTVENGSGQIGYVHPIGALPAAWHDEVFPRK